MHTNTAVVIGGGVIGLSTAYHLARKKFGRVILLEKDRVGEGASGRAGGIITGLLWSRTGVAARKISLALFRALSHELEGYRFHAVGCLNLFAPADWPERERLLPLYGDLDAPYELLDAAEIKQRWPDLRPEADATGLFDPLGGYSEPHRYIPALARRCREMGVETREGRPVTDLVIANGRITGVETPAGRLEADAVICTTHVWTRKLFERLGWQLPVKAFVHQRYTTTPRPAPLSIPAVNANPYGGYVRPAEGNRILVGGETAARAEHPAPAVDFHMSTLSAPTQLKSRLKTNMTPLLPCLEETTWETEQVGLLCFSMDGEPILGPAPSVAGLYLGTAFHSGGFAYNPAAGRLLAELVADGRATLDLTPFAPARFNTDQTEAYLAQTLQQKDAGQRRH